MRSRYQHVEIPHRTEFGARIEIVDKIRAFEQGYRHAGGRQSRGHCGTMLTHDAQTELTSLAKAARLPARHRRRRRYMAAGCARQCPALREREPARKAAATAAAKAAAQRPPARAGPKAPASPARRDCPDPWARLTPLLGGRSRPGWRPFAPAAVARRANSGPVGDRRAQHQVVDELPPC